MICCDGKSESCFQWYHGICVGISPSEGRRMESQGEPFICSYCSGLPALPCYIPANKTSFVWNSSVDGDLFSKRVCQAYDTVVHWHPNLFSVPHGKLGTSELSKLFINYGCSSALESIALKAAMVMPALLLQCPFWKSKPRDHTHCLERRLPLWLGGDIDTLVAEGTSIQDRMYHSNSTRKLIMRITLMYLLV